MAKGFFYILLCSNGMYYAGSTIHLEVRLKQHWSGRVPILQENTLRKNWYMLKNLKELIRHFTVRNKFRDGVIKKRRP
jgi:predicted GIY-YIG superfamily endonuclease